jgi:hypothetical protein
MASGKAQELARNSPRLPPLATEVSAGPPGPEAVVLGRLEDRGRSRPFWAWQSLGRGRVMQIASQELWIWSLTASGMIGDSLSYRSIVTGSLNWLGGQETHNLGLETDRGFYYPDEAVSFLGWSALPEKLSPKVQWGLELTGPGGHRQRLALSHWDRDRFLARVDGLAPGEYGFSAALKVDGRILGRTSGKFWVEPFPGHEREPRLNRELLSEIARVSGGRFARLDSCPSFQQWLGDVSTRRPEGQRDDDCWVGWLLAALLLCGEWLWRRRAGLR